MGERRPSYPGLPPLGGWHTEDKVDALVQALRESMDWRVGFSLEAGDEATGDAARAAGASTLRRAAKWSRTAADTRGEC